MIEPTICLVMIVRDEAKIIKECLSSVTSFIDYWIICDTGSADATPELVQRFFTEKEIPGELHHHEWKDFGYNRSQALALAKNKATYSLIMDADDLFEGSLDKTLLTADSYLLPMKLNSECHFWRVQLLRNEKNWFYETLKNEPDNQRYVFYLAQSFRDAGQPELAIHYYRQRADMGGWQEEVFYSLYMIGFIRQYHLKKPWNECLAAYLTAFDYKPSRVEPLYQIVRFYRLERKFNTALMFGKQALNILNQGKDDILFLNSEVYQWRLFDEVSIAATYAGESELVE